MGRVETREKEKFRSKLKKSEKEGKKPDNPSRIEGKYGSEEDRLGEGGMDLGLSDKKAKEKVFGKKRSLLETLQLQDEDKKKRKKAEKTVPKFMKSGGTIKYRGGGIVSRSRPTKYV